MCTYDTLNLTSSGIPFDHPLHEHVNPPCVHKNAPCDHKTYYWLNSF